jgi:transposase-like protein
MAIWKYKIKEAFMDKYYEDLLIKFIKSSDEPINSNEYKKLDLFIIRKEFFLNLKKLDSYFQMELSQNKKTVLPACPICRSYHIKKHGYLAKTLYCEHCKKTFKANLINNKKEKTYCTHCNSLYEATYDFESTRRYKCLDCNKTFNNSRNSLDNKLHYDNIDKILRLIMIIGNDNESSIPQIAAKLEISIDTFYQWRKKILNVLPQLNRKFKRKST